MPELSPESPSADPLALFEEQLPRIDRVLERTARRRRLVEDEADELRSFVYEHLLANDCAILMKYRGESQWSTFLTVVVQRLFLDFRDHRWGKWRPCAKARRRGDAGILLDRLLRRDGFQVEEAIRILRENHQIRVPAETLRLWAAEFPRHGRPVALGEECLETCCAGERSDAQMVAAERAREVRQVRRTLQQALASLPAEDRLMVKMRYLDGFRISEIARVLSVPQKPLYRRVNAALAQIRRSMEDQGCGLESVAELL